MLNLNRKVGQEIVIGDNIRVMVSSIQGDCVKIGITAPRETTILRAELLDRPPEGFTEMRCGAWVEKSLYAFRHHFRDCRRCIDDAAADRADMAHSDGETQ